MPKVSVIIPTYNRTKYLGDAIQSVLNQTFTDFEIIVVDDGSTDNTKDLVNSFNDSRIRYIYQENRGVSAAQNKGIESANSEYIGILGDDDMYLEHMLEKSVQALDEHPEAGFSYGQCNIMREGTGVYRTRKSPHHSDSTVVGSIEQVRELLLTCPIRASTLVVRSICFEKSGVFNEDLWYAEDYHLFIRLAKKYPGFYIAEPLINFRYHNEQALHNTDRPGKVTAYPLILQEVFEDPEFAPYCEDIKGKIYSHFHRHMMTRSVWGLDMKLARYYLRRSIKFYPRIIFQPAIIYITYKYLASLLPDSLRLSLRNFKRRLVYTLKQRE